MLLCCNKVQNSRMKSSQDYCAIVLSSARYSYTKSECLEVKVTLFVIAHVHSTSALLIDVFSQ